MSDNRWRRDPMGRPYDPYRGFDERGRTAGQNIQDESGYDRGSNRRGAADPGYRPDAYHERDHATDQYRAQDRGQLRGGWEWERARRGEVEGDYGRGYGNRETGPYREHPGGHQGGYRGGHVDRDDLRRGMHPNDRDRGFLDRAADEVSSWFGDDEAERRRRMDDRDRGDWSQQDHARRDRNWSGW